MPTSFDTAIRITGLGKAYRIADAERKVTLAEQALHRLRRPVQKRRAETFWALSDINLEIRRGEVIGLIGRNGAGKSTLLKILSRITPPTKGRVELFGRVGSLLEVGTGFHPELSGRENIYLNGSILGMKRREIRQQFDEIVDFAGIQRFLDTPVKRYSSGMYVRLAFAVAAHLQNEILLVDEVLAVGDQEFQERCLGKMRDVTDTGRTVILVSHNLTSIRALAERCFLLDRGALISEGRPTDVLEGYQRLTSPRLGWQRQDIQAEGAEWRAAELVRARIGGGPTFASGEAIPLELEVDVLANEATRLCTGIVVSALGTPVAAATDVADLPIRGAGRRSLVVRLPGGMLVPGQYSVQISVAALDARQPPRADHLVEDALAFDVAADSASPWLLRNWHHHLFGHVYMPAETHFLADGHPSDE